MKTIIKNNPEAQLEADKNDTVPIFGQELLRDILIPDLLGKDTPYITYWAGKHLARKFPALTIDECADFFQDAGWGALHIISEEKNEMKLELGGELVQRRLRMHTDPCFRLEAGFIAEQVQSQQLVMTEAFEEILKRKGKVILTVRWDLKDPVE